MANGRPRFCGCVANRNTEGVWTFDLDAIREAVLGRGVTSKEENELHRMSEAVIGNEKLQSDALRVDLRKVQSWGGHGP